MVQWSCDESRNARLAWGRGDRPGQLLLRLRGLEPVSRAKEKRFSRVIRYDIGIVRKRWSPTSPSCGLLLVFEASYTMSGRVGPGSTTSTSRSTGWWSQGRGPCTARSRTGDAVCDANLGNYSGRPLCSRGKSQLLQEPVHCIAKTERLSGRGAHLQQRVDRLRHLPLLGHQNHLQDLGWQRGEDAPQGIDVGRVLLPL